MANERLQGEEQFHSKNYLLEMPCSYAKMHLKSARQKLNFVMIKTISKGYTLDALALVAPNALAGPRIITYSLTASFSIKTTLCENSNILFSKNY